MEIIAWGRISLALGLLRFWSLSLVAADKKDLVPRDECYFLNSRRPYTIKNLLDRLVPYVGVCFDVNLPLCASIYASTDSICQTSGLDSLISEENLARWGNGDDQCVRIRRSPQRNGMLDQWQLRRRVETCWSNHENY